MSWKPGCATLPTNTWAWLAPKIIPDLVPPLAPPQPPLPTQNGEYKTFSSFLQVQGNFIQRSSVSTEMIHLGVSVCFLVSLFLSIQDPITHMLLG